MWISIIPPLLEFWLYWRVFFPQLQNINTLFNLYDPASDAILFYLFLPFEIYLLYLTFVFSSMFSAKLMLIIVNLFHKPREGIFNRDPKDRDYAYWSLRNTIIKWPAWVSHTFPIPWHDVILMKLFGVKTNFSNSIFEGWVSCGFVEFGKNISVGQGAIIASSMIFGNYLIIKKIKIGNNAIIGTHAFVSPGTIFGENIILAAYAYTHVDQQLDDGWIYMGIPAQKLRENKFTEPGLEIQLAEDHKEMVETWAKTIEKREATTLKKD